MFQLEKKSDNKSLESSTQRLSHDLIQTKLEIGKPDDKHEKEADAVADRVMRMPYPSNHVQMKRYGSAPDISMKCAKCEEEEKLQMKPSIQRSTNGSTQYASENVGQRLNSSKGSGHALPKHVGHEMESKIGSDFSAVRIHTDSSAIQMNRELGAKAFTHGRDVYFNSGQYNPFCAGGKHLLAHELTHVVQQSSSIPLIRTKKKKQKPCPKKLGPKAPTPNGWKAYQGNPWFFHCGFKGILEDRTPTPDDPQNECFYDKSGALVDKNHAYANCRGTPNQYDSKKNPIMHTLFDSGGIVAKGWDAFWESRRHDVSFIEDLIDFGKSIYESGASTVEDIEKVIDTTADVFDVFGDILDGLGDIP